jgi:hypothetical protein
MIEPPTLRAKKLRNRSSKPQTLEPSNGDQSRDRPGVHCGPTARSHFRPWPCVCSCARYGRSRRSCARSSPPALVGRYPAEGLTPRRQLLFSGPSGPRTPRRARPARTARVGDSQLARKITCGPRAARRPSIDLPSNSLLRSKNTRGSGGTVQNFQWFFLGIMMACTPSMIFLALMLVVRRDAFLKQDSDRA